MNDKLTDVSRHPLRVESDLKFFLKEVNENKKGFANYGMQWTKDCNRINRGCKF